MLPGSILCIMGTQYAPLFSILCMEPCVFFLSLSTIQNLFCSKSMNNNKYD